MFQTKLVRLMLMGLFMVIGWGLAIALIIGSAVTDYGYFRRVFVRDTTVDLSIKMLMDEQNRP